MKVCVRIFIIELNTNYHQYGGRRGRDLMVVIFITTYAISAYHH